MKNGSVPHLSRTRPHGGDSSGTTPGHSPKTVENQPKPQVETSPGTVGTAGTLTPPERDRRCGGRWPGWACNATLNAHNITGLCAECKLIQRQERRTGSPADPSGWVTAEESAANLTVVFGKAPS